MSQTTMIAMLEEAEDVLRRAGCDMTADKVRGVLQARQVEPNINDPQYRIGYTNGWADFADAVKAASEIKAAKQQAEPVGDGESIDFPIAFLTTESGGGKYKLVLSFASLPDLHKGHNRILSAIKHRQPSAQQQAVAVPEGCALVKTPITEEMHRSAIKVLCRATGNDGLPQRMLNAMLAAAPQAAVDCTSRTVESESQAGLYRNDEAQDEPGPIIRQFGYQPLFNAISSATKWRDGRTIEISVLDFQKALLDTAQKGGAPC